MVRYRNSHSDLTLPGAYVIAKGLYLWDIHPNEPYYSDATPVHECKKDELLLVITCVEGSAFVVSSQSNKCGWIEAYEHIEV